MRSLCFSSDGTSAPALPYSLIRGFHLWIRASITKWDTREHLLVARILALVMIVLTRDLAAPLPPIVLLHTIHK